jgi:hypothetical protein
MQSGLSTLWHDAGLALEKNSLNQFLVYVKSYRISSTIKILTHRFLLANEKMQGSVVLELSIPWQWAWKFV